MIDIIKIVYVTDWAIGNNTLSNEDPFGEVLLDLMPEVSIQEELPDFFDDIDLIRFSILCR
jgi:hypothetical protein